VCVVRKFLQKKRKKKKAIIKKTQKEALFRGEGKTNKTNKTKIDKTPPKIGTSKASWLLEKSFSLFD